MRVSVPFDDPATSRALQSLVVGPAAGVRTTSTMPTPTPTGSSVRSAARRFIVVERVSMNPGITAVQKRMSVRPIIVLPVLIRYKRS